MHIIEEYSDLVTSILVAIIIISIVSITAVNLRETTEMTVSNVSSSYSNDWVVYDSAVDSDDINNDIVDNLTEEVASLSEKISSLTSELSNVNSSLISQIEDNAEEIASVDESSAGYEGWWTGGAAATGSMFSVESGIYNVHPGNYPSEMTAIKEANAEISYYGTLVILSSKGYTSIMYISVFGESCVWDSNQSYWKALNYE